MPSVRLTLRESDYDNYEISWIVFGLGTLCVKEGETGHLEKWKLIREIKLHLIIFCFYFVSKGF